MIIGNLSGFKNWLQNTKLIINKYLWKIQRKKYFQLKFKEIFY